MSSQAMVSASHWECPVKLGILENQRLKHGCSESQRMSSEATATTTMAVMAEEVRVVTWYRGTHCGYASPLDRAYANSMDAIMVSTLQ